MQIFQKIFNKDSVGIPLAAIVLGLLTGAVVMLIGGFNPLVAYGALVKKVFGTGYDFAEAVRQVTPLIFTGIAVAFAFRAGLFNIGAEGQFIMGMAGAALVGIKLNLPMYLHTVLAVVAGGLFGALWAGIAGYLKAKRGVNEVISTIMLNWIGLYLANLIVIKFMQQQGQQRSVPIHNSASASLDWLSRELGNARVHWGTLLALVCVFLFYVILWKTRQGYELRATGLNPEAARYAGMNVGTNIVKAMMISGAFAGFGGAFEVLGVFKYEQILSVQPGYGFDGIAVSLLGGNTPIGVLLAAILFGFLTYGSAGMSFVADVPNDIIRIVIGAVIFFVASHGIVRLLFKTVGPKRRDRNEKEAS